VDQLSRVLEEELSDMIELARSRMRKRMEAKEANEKVLREIKQLTHDMEFEIRVVNKAKEQKRERRERKERKRLGK